LIGVYKIEVSFYEQISTKKIGKNQHHFKKMNSILVDFSLFNE